MSFSWKKNETASETLERKTWIFHSSSNCQQWMRFTKLFLHVLLYMANVNKNYAIGHEMSKTR